MKDYVNAYIDGTAAPLRKEATQLLTSFRKLLVALSLDVSLDKTDQDLLESIQPYSGLIQRAASVFRQKHEVKIHSRGCYVFTQWPACWQDKNLRLYTPLKDSLPAVKLDFNFINPYGGCERDTFPLISFTRMTKIISLWGELEVLKYLSGFIPLIKDPVHTSPDASMKKTYFHFW